MLVSRPEEVGTVHVDGTPPDVREPVCKALAARDTLPAETRAEVERIGAIKGQAAREGTGIDAPGRFSVCSVALRRSRQDLFCTIYPHFSVAANTWSRAEGRARIEARTRAGAGDAVPGRRAGRYEGAGRGAARSRGVPAMKPPAALPRAFDGWLFDPVDRGFTGTQRRWLHRYGLIDAPVGVYHVTEAGRALLEPQRERAQRFLDGGEPFDARKPRRVLAGSVRARDEKRWTKGRSEHDPTPWCFGRVTDAEGRVWLTSFALLIARVPKRLRVAPAEAWTQPVEPKSVSARRRGAPGVARGGDVVRRAGVRGVARGREAQHPRPASTCSARWRRARPRARCGTRPATACRRWWPRDDT